VVDLLGSRTSKGYNDVDVVDDDFVLAGDGGTLR
jgi:hypothetical protein